MTGVQTCALPISSDTNNPVPAASTEDEYLAKFASLDALLSTLRTGESQLSAAKNDQERVRALTKIVLAQRRCNDSMYDLMVEMNNFFGRG